MKCEIRKMMYGGWTVSSEGYVNGYGTPIKDFVTDEELTNRVTDALDRGYQVEISN